MIPKPYTQVTDLKNEDGQDICAAVSVLNPTPETLNPEP
jgi:hypothetical protein